LAETCPNFEDEKYPKFFQRKRSLQKFIIGGRNLIEYEIQLEDLQFESVQVKKFPISWPLGLNFDPKAEL
jgi:hypothetical protein